jgi:hypothetical protein
MIPWSEFPTECLWYLVVAGVWHLFAFGVGGVFVGFLPTKQPGQFRRGMRRLASFLAIFLVVGAFFNGLWSCLIYGRFYESADYLSGFLPFCPLTKFWLEMPDRSGQLMDVPIQLQFIWLLFTIATWGITILLYQCFRRRLVGKYHQVETSQVIP